MPPAEFRDAGPGLFFGTSEDKGTVVEDSQNLLSENERLHEFSESKVTLAGVARATLDGHSVGGHFVSDAVLVRFGSALGVKTKIAGVDAKMIGESDVRVIENNTGKVFETKVQSAVALDLFHQSSEQRFFWGFDGDRWGKGF